MRAQTILKRSVNNLSTVTGTGLTVQFSKVVNGQDIFHTVTGKYHPGFGCAIAFLKFERRKMDHLCLSTYPCVRTNIQTAASVVSLTERTGQMYYVQVKMYPVTHKCHPDSSFHSDDLIQNLDHTHVRITITQPWSRSHRTSCLPGTPPALLTPLSSL